MLEQGEETAATAQLNLLGSDRAWDKADAFLILVNYRGMNINCV